MTNLGRSSSSGGGTVVRADSARTGRAGGDTRTLGLSRGANGFVGRRQELEKVAVLLVGSNRLITLTGAGGVGKTRLAEEAVDRFRRSVGCRVHWVNLAELPIGSDASVVGRHVARIVLGGESSGSSHRKALADKLADTVGGGCRRKIVLVLDNCEHVLAGVAHVIDDLLSGADELTVLTTTREPIGWIDERLVVIPPLPREHSLVLFGQRAERAGVAISDSDQLEVAARIGERLNHNPLFLQIAAARLLRRSLAAVLHELTCEDDRRLDWTYHHRIGGDMRHASIEASVSWSYRLCDEPERILLERMSIFSAGVDPNPDDGAATIAGAELEAVGSVCADAYADGTAPQIAGMDIELLLDRLSDRSLVSRKFTSSRVYYLLSPTIRLFARRQLNRRSEAGPREWDRLRTRHREYYQRKLREHKARWSWATENDLQQWLGAAWENILFSLEGVDAHSDRLDIAQLLFSLRAPFFGMSDTDRRRLAGRISSLANAPAATHDGRRQDAVATVGCLALIEGGIPELDTVLSALREPRDGAAAVDFTSACAMALVYGDTSALDLLARAREKFSESGDRRGAAVAALVRSSAAAILADPADAVEITRCHREHMRKTAVEWAGTWAELMYAIALLRNDAPARALTVLRVVMQQFLTTRNLFASVCGIHVWILCLGRLITAVPSDRSDRRTEIVGWAAQVVRLSTGVQAICEKADIAPHLLKPFATELLVTRKAARRVLGDKRYAQAEREGAQLQPDSGELIHLALEASPVRKVRVQVADCWGGLANAEQEVALLVAAGWTNVSIAALRGTSPRTVDAQVCSIFHKLGVESRREIIRHIPETRIERVRAAAAHRPVPVRARAHRG